MKWSELKKSDQKDLSIFADAVGYHICVFHCLASYLLCGGGYNNYIPNMGSELWMFPALYVTSVGSEGTNSTAASKVTANHHLDTYSAAYDSMKFVQDRMKDASISYKKRVKLLLEFPYKFRSRADIEVFRRSVSSDINDTRFLEPLLDSKQAVERVNSSVLSAVSNL